MKRTLIGALAALAYGAGASAQGMAPADTLGPSGVLIAPQAVARAPRTYAETTVAVTANSLILVFPGSLRAQKIVIGDAAGLGCVWSLNRSAAAGEGVPFSLSGAAGSYVFDDPVPTNPVFVRCAASGVLTVASA